MCYFYLYSKIALSLVFQIVSFLLDTVGTELKDYWDLMTLRTATRRVIITLTFRNFNFNLNGILHSVETSTAVVS